MSDNGVYYFEIIWDRSIIECLTDWCHHEYCLLMTFVLLQMVLDHETFIMNLTAANIEDRPVWMKEYSAKVLTVHFVEVLIHLNKTLLSMGTCVQLIF